MQHDEAGVGIHGAAALLHIHHQHDGVAEPRVAGDVVHEPAVGGDQLSQRVQVHALDRHVPMKVATAVLEVHSSKRILTVRPTQQSDDACYGDEQGFVVTRGLLQAICRVKTESERHNHFDEHGMVARRKLPAG